MPTPVAAWVMAEEISSGEGWRALMSTLGRVKRLVISSRTATCTSRPGATSGEANWTSTSPTIVGACSTGEGRGTGSRRRTARYCDVSATVGARFVAATPPR